MKNSVLEKFEAGFKGYHKDAPAYLKSKREELAGKMKKGKSYKKEIDNKKPSPKKDSERFEENGGQSGK